MKKELIIIRIVAIFLIVCFAGCTKTNGTNNQNAVSPVIIAFSANPYSIDYGDTAVLSWQVINATSAFIDNGIGNVSLTGTRVISPTKTTLYMLTATNGDNMMDASVEVVVK